MLYIFTKNNYRNDENWYDDMDAAVMLSFY